MENDVTYPDQTQERTVTPRGDLAADEKTTIELFEKSRGSVVYITTAQLGSVRKPKKYDFL